MARNGPSDRFPSDAHAGTSLRDRSSAIVAGVAVLALLYFGRDVFIPLTLALMLSLLLAPLVRRLRQVGLGPTPSVLAAVLVLVLTAAAIALVLGTQVVRMAASLPQYQQTIQQKLESLDEMTVGRLDALTGEVTRLIESHSTGGAAGARTQIREPQALPPQPSPPAESLGTRAGSVQRFGRVLAAVWAPVETTGIVLVVLVFVLLEYEALRDRFIRIAGGTDIRLTTLALNDAGERLSRFFVSQFTVNLCVGAAVGVGLALMGVPNAIFWAALTAVLRFVPYVGVWIAALFATAMAIAVVPGWSLALSTLGLFVLVELIAAQGVEPHLYGHATGLSPLSVVVAAIFWSALWGPIGLILSVPLTLCLLVGGRHIKALNVLYLLLGDVPALTLPQKFYQRALSGDSSEIIENARAYLKHNSLASYCDVVMIPALQLALLDRQIGSIGEDQQKRLREVTVEVASTIGAEQPKLSRRRRTAVLDGSSIGEVLRRQREQSAGKWQGPLAVPRGSVVICLGLGSTADDFAAELLVRVLREKKLDARHFSLRDLNDPLPPGATAGGIGLVYLVSAFPGEERDRREAVARRIRESLPGAPVMMVLLPGMSHGSESLAEADKTGMTVTSFVEALQFCLERQPTSPRA